jgi:hypothetical protein
MQPATNAIVTATTIPMGERAFAALQHLHKPNLRQMLFERGMSGAAPSSISAASIELAGAAGGKRLGQQSEIKPCELCCVPLNYSNAGHFAAKYPPFPPATRMTPLPLVLLLLLSHHSLSGILLLSVGCRVS